jgi:hypothetical protein
MKKLLIFAEQMLKEQIEREKSFFGDPYEQGVRQGIERIVYLIRRQIGKPFFHELSQQEIDQLVAEGMTFGYMAQHYNQPEWCIMPHALSSLGCWSLTDVSANGKRTQISPQYCKDCDYYSPLKPSSGEGDSTTIKSDWNLKKCLMAISLNFLV